MQEAKNSGMENALENLAKNIARWTEKGELHTTPIPGLSLFRREEPTEPVTGMYEPSICMVAQGAKRVLLGEESFVYDAHHYLITAVFNICSSSQQVKQRFRPWTISAAILPVPVQHPNGPSIQQ